MVPPAALSPLTLVCKLEINELVAKSIGTSGVQTAAVSDPLTPHPLVEKLTIPIRSVAENVLFKKALTAVFNAAIFDCPVPVVLDIDPDRSSTSIKSTGLSGPASATALTLIVE